MFGYPCPSCAQRLLAAPERVGQRTICPKCLKPIVIPAPVAARPDPDPIPQTDDEPDHIFAPVVVANVPLTHNVDGDQESALMADAAAQADELANEWRGSRPVLTLDPPPVLAPTTPVIELPPEPEPEPEPEPLPLPPPPPPPMVRPTVRAVPPTPPAQTPPSTPTPAPAALRSSAASRVSTARPPAADRAAPGMVVFSPTAVESQDIAADLTAALTLRMKPPPEPPADLPLSTGLWLALTAVALSLWLVGTLYGPGPLGYVLVLGGVQVLFGVGWATVHAVRRHGPAGLLPPVVGWRLLAPPPSLGYRPLRFVLTGAGLIALFFLAVPARPVARGLLGVTDPAAVTVPEVAETPLLRLTAARRLDNAEQLHDVLKELAAPAAVLSAGPDAPGMVAELRGLAADQRSEVRAAALAALVTWDADKAKPDVLAALRSDNDRERRAAIGLAVRWRDPVVAAAVAGRLSDREEADEAAAALRRIGGEPAEAAVLPLLADRDLTARAYALEVVAEVGGAKAAAALEGHIERLKAEETRRPYRQALARIKERLKG